MNTALVHMKRSGWLEVNLCLFFNSGVSVMKNFSKSFQAFWADEDGATAIEYGLLASLIAVAIVASAGDVGAALVLKFEEIAAALA